MLLILFLLTGEKMKQKILCVIGARGKSVRLKNKNIQKYGNTTLLEWAITNALKSKYIDQVVVDSEDNKILEIAKKYPVKLHQRDNSMSKDDVSLYIPVKHVIEDYPEYNIVVIMQVDNPVENHIIIDRCIETILEHDNAHDVSTFHNNTRTGTVRVIKRVSFFDGIPTANFYSVEDRLDYIDIHTSEDLSTANKYFKNQLCDDTFKVSHKIREPIKYNTHMIFNHFNRYSQAIQSLKISKFDTVIDASCGQGYGSYILSLHAKRVWGLDVNKDHLKKSDKIYKTDNINFHTYDEYNKFNSGNLRFVIDKIVCIETIEHMSKTNQITFIRNILDMLKKGGDMFITTPLGTDKPSKYDKNHLSEPSIEFLNELLVKHFDSVNIKINKYINSFGYDINYCMISLYKYMGEKK